MEKYINIKYWESSNINKKNFTEREKSYKRNNFKVKKPLKGSNVQDNIMS